MKTNEINIRDPFVLTYDGMYYMYGSRSDCQTGFDVYKSGNLEDWSGPKVVFEKNDDFWGTKEFWAPEVYYYRGRFFMFASFGSETSKRGMAVLVCDTPDGEFKVYNERITPDKWNCLDGTIYVEDNLIYLVFCHEWTEIKVGEVCAVRLSEDFKKAVGEPFILWKATDAAWTRPLGKKEDGNYVTDGPFLYIDSKNRLVSLWSSFAEKGYALARSYSDSGSIHGNWIHDENLIFEKNGGHGMIFEKNSGEKMLVIHCPNENPNERAVFFRFEE